MAVDPAKTVVSLGTILGIWAHPDDETFMTGGLMNIACKQGQKVACITATRGDAGTQNEEKWPLEGLSDVRTHELETALSMLGSVEHHWLTYGDGKCHQISDDEALTEIYKIVQKVRPDSIITFPPDGLTGHLDHQAVSRWSRMVASKCDWPIKVYYAVDTQEQYDNFIKEADEKFNIYFNVDKPVLVAESQANITVKLSDDTAKVKTNCLKAMPSQTEGMFNEKGDEWFAKVFCRESLVSADRNDIIWNTKFKSS